MGGGPGNKQYLKLIGILNCHLLYVEMYFRIRSLAEILSSNTSERRIISDCFIAQVDGPAAHPLILFFLLLFDAFLGLCCTLLKDGPKRHNNVGSLLDQIGGDVELLQRGDKVTSDQVKVYLR